MRKGLIIFLAALCLSLSSLPVSAAESCAFSSVLSGVEGKEGETVELSIRYDGSLGEIGAFLVRVEFDPDIFEYQRVRTAPAVRDAYSLTLPGEGWIDSGYVMKSREECLASPGDTFTYRFKVLEGAEQDETAFSVSVYQVVSPDSIPLDAADTVLSYVVLPPPSGDAALVSLSPSLGELKPAFSPDCFAYTMTVPFEAVSLSFLAEPAEGAICKVNRKSLGAGGSETEFLLTVTAEDGKTKEIYRVTVYREEKAASPSPSAASRPTPEPEPVKTPSPEPETGPGPESGGFPAETTASSSTPQPEQERPSPSPIPALSGTASTPPGDRHKAETSDSRPSVTVLGGAADFLSSDWKVICMIAIVGVSGPLARQICRWDREEKKK